MCVPLSLIVIDIAGEKGPVLIVMAATLMPYDERGVRSVIVVLLVSITVILYITVSLVNDTI